MQEWGYAKDSKPALVEKMLMRFNLIRIDPEEIIYLSIHPTRGAEKNIWKRNYPFTVGPHLLFWKAF